LNSDAVNFFIIALLAENYQCCGKNIKNNDLCRKHQSQNINATELLGFALSKLFTHCCWLYNFYKVSLFF